MLKRFNQWMNKFSTPLNILNIIVGLLFGIAHVYIPLTSVLGLVLGVIMAVSGSASMAISYYFTTKSTQNNEPPRKHTLKSSLFLAVAIPLLLLNSASSFFGMYTGTILLAAALALPIAPAAVISIAVVLATIMTLGTLINSWLQTNYLWERFKKPGAPLPATQPLRVLRHPGKQRVVDAHEPELVREARPAAVIQLNTRVRRVGLFEDHHQRPPLQRVASAPSVMRRM